MTKEQLIKDIINSDFKKIEDKVESNRNEMKLCTEESLVNAFNGHHDIAVLLVHLKCKLNSILETNET